MMSRVRRPDPRDELWSQYCDDPEAYGLDFSEYLVKQIERLKAAIRRHRDELGDDRCWLDDQRLYEVLGEPAPPKVALPPKEDFLKSCERFWTQRQTPLDHGTATLPGCMTIGQLTREGDRLRELNAELAEEGGKLASWIEAIHWSEHETNTAGWLEGLREQLDAFEAVYNKARGLTPPSPSPA